MTCQRAYFGNWPVVMLPGLGMVAFPKQSWTKSTSAMRCFMPAMKVGSGHMPFAFAGQPLIPVRGRTASFRIQRMYLELSEAGLAMPLAGQVITCPTRLAAYG